MKTFFAFVLILVTVSLTAQTRRIAHRFHSGTDNTQYASGDGSYGGPYIPMKYVHITDTITFAVGKDSVVRIVDTAYYELDTSNMHKNRTHGNLNSASEYGKICSSYTGK
jgi:hypothetical protein